VSRYQVWRRRLAPVAFGIAIAVLARDSCTKTQRTHATVVLDLGSGARDARALDADVLIGDDVLATYHKAALPGSGLGATKFEASIPAEDADVRIDIDLGTRHVKVARRIHIVEGSTVTVPLERDLLAP
jgi:hypothetical protein